MQVPMSEEQFAGLVSKAREQGIALDGREGTIEKMGVKANWVYDGANLLVDVVDKPFFLTREAVEDMLRKQLGS